MLSLFLTEDMSEFINIIKEFIEDSYEELLEVDHFFDDYHIFLYDITEKCNNNTEYLYLIKYLINSSIKVLKNFNKDYNKNICKKDKYFFITRKILGDLEANSEYLDDYLEDSFELTDFKVIWFIINDLKYQLNVLNKKHTSRLLFSTEAVNIILQYLVKLKVLKYNIDLKEYPDIVQLLMPFDFVFRSFGNNWNIIEKKTLGFDLRNIKKSNLSHLFNIDVVNMYINSGGIYVVNKIISNNKTYYES